MKIRSIASSSSGNCHIVEHNGSRLMLDAGLTKKQLRSKQVKLSDLAGCLCSHLHSDHSKGVRDLLKAAVDVYLLESTATALQLPRSHRRHIITPMQYFKVGSFEVAGFEGFHNVPVLGFQIKAGDERLVYLTDTAYCQYTFPGLTHLIVEANYDPDSLEASAKHQPELVRRVIHDHLGAENVIKILEDNDLSKLKEVRLVHLSDANANEEVIVSLVKEVLPDKVVLTVAQKNGGVKTYE